MKEFPWLTATCCGTHVMNLELKDMAQISSIKEVHSKVNEVLALFWGKKRWPRKKLREVIQENHKTKFGLYRAKQTRFAGKFREMSRMLRVKADLQQVVVCQEYGQQRFTARGLPIDPEDVDDADTEDVGVGSHVKSIVLDDNGFWKPLTLILYVALPLVRLLRMFDSNKSGVIGKVYDRMFVIGERINKLRDHVEWADEMASVHADRWEYLHSPFHSAAYALDPEYLSTVGGIDAATQEGLTTVIERMCLRDAIMASSDPEAAMASLTTSSPEVVQRVAQAEREFALYQGQDGPFSRLSVVENAKTMDPSRWWNTYGKHLPILSAIAPRVLAQPAAASAAERNWSVTGQIRSANRSRMQHKTADKLVFCKESLHLEAKLQGADWVPDVEKWESDEDSDHSEIEMDFDEEGELQASAIEKLVR